jgi:hypothetical protein
MKGISKYNEVRETSEWIPRAQPGMLPKGHKPARRTMLERLVWKGLLRMALWEKKLRILTALFDCPERSGVIVWGPRIKGISKASPCMRPRPA